MRTAGDEYAVWPMRGSCRLVPPLWRVCQMSDDDQAQRQVPSCPPPAAGQHRQRSLTTWSTLRPAAGWMFRRLTLPTCQGWAVGRSACTTAWHQRYMRRERQDSPCNGSGKLTCRHSVSYFWSQLVTRSSGEFSQVAIILLFIIKSYT